MPAVEFVVEAIEFPDQATVAARGSLGASPVGLNDTEIEIAAAHSRMVSEPIRNVKPEFVPLA